MLNSIHILMKKEKDNLVKEITIPEGIESRLKDNIIYIKKNDIELTRKFHPLIIVAIEKNKITLSAKKNRRTEKKLLGTTYSHIINMIKVLEQGFTYKLQIVNVHFPMSMSYDKDKNELIVKNFLGEKKDRKIKLEDGINVKINKDIIELASCDIEKAGRAATRIEQGTKVRNKDRRVYQDGIFLIEKPGRSYL